MTGLSASEVNESRRQYGSNILTPPPTVPLWRQFLNKFRDPLIIILMIAGVLSVGISCYEYWGIGDNDAGVFFEPIGIFIAILLATGLSFWFEVKAGREFRLLNQVNDAEPVQVMRGGKVMSVERRDVVVGDIVYINTGDEIPADGQLFEAVSLSVDESTLTGEPVCHKSVDPTQFDPEATYPTDMVLRGTRVMEGHGMMEVTAVGDETENGKVHVAATIDNSVKTPLDIQLERLGTLISRITYVLAAVIIIGRLITYFVNVDTPHGEQFDWLGFGAYMLNSVMIAVALIVVAVPEGLPMAVTLSLAYSMRRMLRTNNLVRKLHACETMGATTVICTDKTGTLTQNRMQVAHFDIFGDVRPEIINLSMALNSTAQLSETDGRAEVLGNPTEGALLLYMAGQGVDYRQLRRSACTVGELPFATERKYMATVTDIDGHRYLFVKGAPEIVFGLCGDCSDLSRDEIDAQLMVYQRQAMRTLGFAYKELSVDETVLTDDRVIARGLKFIAIAAISDPVRSDVPQAVDEVIRAGVGVKIVTGDTPGTAKEIARQIGMWTDDRDTDANIITGIEFEQLDDSELRRRVGDLKIIARARPMDKKRLVEALQANGEVVAVTGDGTNDAPALKAAHVGLSMGDGTSVAKEASDITIIDNSFSSIGRAVMWGRSLYRNIQRFILFQMTVNVVACLIVLSGAFMGLQSPLTVTQMLWVNLIMDTFAAVALSSLPPSADVMTDKPRSRSAFIISRQMWRDIIGIGGVFFILLFGLLYYFNHTDVTSVSQIMSSVPGTSGGLNEWELTMFFTTFVMLQFWNLFNARAFGSTDTSLHLRGARGFCLIAMLVLVGQIAIVTFGGEFFTVTPLSVTDWIVVIALTSPVLFIGEIIRCLERVCAIRRARK